MYQHELGEHKEKRKLVPARMPVEAESAHDWQTMKEYLRRRGLSYETACHNGWYPSDCAGDSNLRIVMPATNSVNMAYWQARSVYDKDPRYQSPNVPRGDSVLQVWPLHMDYNPVAILCEGPMDALAAATHGIRGIALMGNNPTAETLHMLSTMLDADDVVTYFADRDAIKESIEIVKSLQKLGIYATVSDPSPYKDLASVPVKQREKVLQAYSTIARSRHSVKKGVTRGH